MKLLLSLMYRAAIPACALLALLIVYPHALYAATATSGCGTIAADTVWPADHVYVIDGCDLTIEAGATLTIQPGTVVKSWIERGLTVQGVLSAQGTGDNPIIFTSLADDTHGGDTNGDGPSQGGRGDWAAITVAAGGSARISHAEITYGGGNYYFWNTKANLRCFDGEVVLDHVTLRESAVSALYAERCKVEFTNGRVEANGTAGLRLIGLAADSPVRIEGNTFAAPPASSIAFDGNPHGPVTIRNNHSPGGTVGFVLENTLNGNLDWDNAAMVLLSGRGFTVGLEATLRLAPGSVVKSWIERGLTIQGVLSAQGTGDNPIIFTSLADDTHGGDTNGDGPSTGSKGDWSAVTVGEGGYAHLSHAAILHGGYYYYWWDDNAGLRCDGGDAVLEDVTLRDNSHNAVLARNGPVRIRDSRVVDNEYGVVTRVGGRVDARHNWWGDVSGPHNDTANPEGAGAGISNGVGFEPWLGTFNWLGEDDALFHDAETLAWATYGRDTSGLTVDIQVAGGSTTKSIATGLPATGTFSWQSRNVPDGRYELRATLRDAGSALVAKASRTILVNNAAGIVWHGGRINDTETWAADKIHVVEKEVEIEVGGAVNVAAGAVVKAAPETRILVLNGGRMTIAATAGSPTILTSFADDEGGDTNLDGSATEPLPGDWTGLAAFGTGQLSVAVAADIRYTAAVHGGTVRAGESWDARRLHLVPSGVTVPAGVTLTIAAGAQVKFGPKSGITVQSGGRLVAAGSAAEPIAFTSDRDDAVAGDTNRDGTATEPAPGDWKGLRFDGGEGTIDHARIAYAGGTESGTWDSAAGAVSALRGAVVSVSNSEILWPLFEAVKAWQGGYSEGGDVTVTSSVLAGADRGVNADGSSVVRLVNATVDDCRVGIWGHGGQIDIVNSIISNSGEVGIDNVLESPLTIRHSDVWSAEGANYGSATEDPTGRDGNISADPKYVAAERGDYRLDYQSPATDAADGGAAPATDARGVARYDDPRSPNTGLPAGNGAYADMGAYEFADNAPSSLDLVVTSVSGPTVALAGDTVTVRWTVHNSGSQTVAGPWHDTVSLVLSPGANPTVIPAGEIAVGEGVRLGPGQSYGASAEIRVPGNVAGAHYWQVVTNTRDEVFEGKNHANNSRLSDVPVMLDLPELVVDGAALSRQFDTQGQEHWFKFSPEAGEDVLVSLDRAGTGGATELYIAQGSMPTRSRFDVRQSEAHAADATVVVAGTSTQTYYVLAYPASLPDGAGAFTIRATALQFGIESVTPAEAGNGGRVTLAVHGGKLGEDLIFEIVDSHGGVHAATSVFIVDSSLAYATFDLTGLPPGSYDVRARQGERVVTLDGGVNVIAGTPGQVEVQLGMPAALRPDWTGTVTVDYANTGDTDVVAPLIVVNVSNAHLRLPGKTEFAYPTVQLLGINSEGPAGILPPGAGGTVELEMKPTGDGNIDGKVWVLSDPGWPWDWSATKSLLRPSFVPEDAWDAIFANFTADVGTTVGEYQQKLADDATYLSRLGEYTHDVQRLLAFELNQAGLNESTRRYTLGAFGRGAQAWWEIEAAEDGAGNVTIGTGSSLRFFRHRDDGSYRGVAGDRAVLTRVDGGYRLREPNGQVVAFDRTGKMQFVEDTNGNRSTATYTAERLTRFTLSNGDTIIYTYDANGRVATVTEPVGRTFTYAYDPAGEHLVSIDGPAGTVAFSYFQGEGAARAHAVQSVAFPDGTHLFYEYDDRGRLVDARGDGGAGAVHYEYGPSGEATMTNGTDDPRRLFFDDTGQVARIDGAGSTALSVGYDDQHRPVEVNGPGGVKSRLIYDASGNLATMVDPLGGQIHLAHEPTFQRVTALTDPKGATTTFAYDEKANLTGVTFPDGGSQSFVYDAVGNPTAWTNGRGEVVHYVYDAKNLLVREEFPGNAYRRSTYDAHRNLITATDASGTTRLEYDGADRLTKITYPSGRFLRFTYDAGGRRIRREDRDGFVLKYTYDAVGRLSALSDGSDATIVAYSYDQAGRLAREELGNGTYTTYEYDAAGRVTHLVNRRDDDSVLSRFDYTFDDSGRRTRMVTRDGEWTYTYDAGGQLTHAVFASTNPAVESQDLSYFYDSAGNRVRTVLNGVGTDYEVNESDQYTKIGTSPYNYDADGNLVSRGNGADTWTYSYDTENRLVSLSGPGGTWTYEYDVFGNRVAASHDGQRTEFLVDPSGGGDVVATFDGAGTLTARYVHAVGLVSRIDANGQPAYFTFDALGSTSEITDSAGNVLDRYAYRPFGEPLIGQESAENPFEYAGEHGVTRDPHGLLFMRARYYDPRLGRFIQRDPLGTVQGPNLYQYAGADAVNRLDASGTFWLTDLFWEAKDFMGSVQPMARWEVEVWVNYLKFEEYSYFNYGRQLQRWQEFHEAWRAESSFGNFAKEFGRFVSGKVRAGARVVSNAARTVGTRITQGLSSLSELQIEIVDVPAIVSSPITTLGTPLAELGAGTIATGAVVAGAVGVAIGTGLRYIPGVDENAQSAWIKLNDWTGGWLFGTPPAAELGTPVVSSHDPNDLIGPAGSGSTHWVTAGQTLLYTIRFENDKNATAPAQAVHITEQLDPNLDFTTLELASFGFADVVVNVPAGRTFYSERLDLRDTYGLFVDVTGELNMDTGVVTWEFASIDPDTGQPPRDPLAGFLPPNTESPTGEGFVRYTIRAGTETDTGVPVQARASIVFDTNEPIPTNVHVNPIGPIADCTGDCNSDGGVTIDELITGVRIALGMQSPATCAALDRNASGEVTIEEIIAAVNNALRGCPVAPTPAPTWTHPPVPPTATRTPSPTRTRTTRRSPSATLLPTATRTPSPTRTVAPPTVTVAPTHTHAPPTPTPTSTQAAGFATPTPPASGTPGPTLPPGGHLYCDTLSAPLPIPDADETGTSDSITITESIPIGSLRVRLQINHTWVGDLFVDLNHVETLTTATLLAFPGATPEFPDGCDGDDVECTLDDTASNPAGGECSLSPPAIGGTVAPLQPLTAFAGESTAGTWALRLADFGVEDTGSLVHWCLEVQ